MLNIASAHVFFRYGDWANQQLLAAAGKLTDAQLDQPFDMGPGSLRRTLIHIYNGEHVWLNRWQCRAETPWPSESDPLSVAELGRRFAACAQERDVFVATLTDASLAREITYRDSKGSLFQASLSDMLIQAINHSIHHRAQAVNMLRRLNAGLVELDYMMWRRRPATPIAS